MNGTDSGKPANSAGSSHTNGGPTRNGGRKSKKYRKRGLLTSPGTLTYIGPDIGLKTKIRRIRYSEHMYKEEAVKSLDECRAAENGENFTTWLNIDGIHEVPLIEKLGKLYHLHPLLLEDVVNTEHKPKLELYDTGHLFLTLKMLHVDSESPISISSEHVSFVLGKNYVLSFQEELTSDIFTTVENRLEASCQRRVLFDVLAILIQSGRADHM